MGILDLIEIYQKALPDCTVTATRNLGKHGVVFEISIAKSTEGVMSTVYVPQGRAGSDVLTLFPPVRIYDTLADIVSQFVIVWML